MVSMSTMTKIAFAGVISQTICVNAAGTAITVAQCDKDAYTIAQNTNADDTFLGSPKKDVVCPPGTYILSTGSIDTTVGAVTDVASWKKICCKVSEKLPVATNTAQKVPKWTYVEALDTVAVTVAEQWVLSGWDTATTDGTNYVAASSQTACAAGEALNYGAMTNGSHDGSSGTVAAADWTCATATASCATGKYQILKHDDLKDGEYGGIDTICLDNDAPCGGQCLSKTTTKTDDECLALAANAIPMEGLKPADLFQDSSTDYSKGCTTNYNKTSPKDMETCAGYKAICNKVDSTNCEFVEYGKAHGKINSTADGVMQDTVGTIQTGLEIPTLQPFVRVCGSSHSCGSAGSSSSSGLGGGAIAGIVIGSVVAIGAVGAAIWWCKRPAQ